MDNLNNRETNSHVFFYTNYLSNFHICKIVDPATGILFKSSEQMFMYYKCKYHGDKEAMERCTQETNPKNVKAIGREIKNFTETWNTSGAAYRAMLYVNILKYSQNEQIKLSLLGTGNKTLVEAAGTNDYIWGCGFRANDEKINFETNWTGTNLLGKVLMEVRTILRQN